jgi:hypothetical protein
MHFLIKRLHAHQARHVTSILPSLVGTWNMLKDRFYTLNRIRYSIKLASSEGMCSRRLAPFGPRVQGLGFRVPLVQTLHSLVHHSPCDLQSVGVCASRSKMISEANPSTQPWRSRKPCVPPNRVETLPPSSARQFKPFRADTVGCARRSYHGTLDNCFVGMRAAFNSWR